MKIGILASTDNRITDYYLGNQLIRHFEVPVILMHRPPGYRRHRALRKGCRIVREQGLTQFAAEARNWWFERSRQRAFCTYLNRRFARLGEKREYDSGPEQIEVNDLHAAASLQLLREREVTLLFLNGAGIIHRPLIDLATDGVVNVHHGYLPDIRGCHSIAWGLLERRPEWVGVSVHLVDEGIDTGPILKRQHVPPRPDSTYESLFCQATIAGGQLLVEAIREIADRRARILPRDAPGTYRSVMSREDWETLAKRDRRLPCPPDPDLAAVTS